MNKVYTFGYQGHKPEDLLAVVSEMGGVVADIRLRPVSRNPVWNKGKLEVLFGSRYVHVPQLGNLNYKTGGPAAIADMEAGLKIVLGLLEQRPVILMCVCKDFQKCHRSIVAADLEGRGVEVEEMLLPSTDIDNATAEARQQSLF